MKSEHNIAVLCMVIKVCIVHAYVAVTYSDNWEATWLW